MFFVNFTIYSFGRHLYTNTFSYSVFVKNVKKTKRIFPMSISCIEHNSDFGHNIRKFVILQSHTCAPSQSMYGVPNLMDFVS